MTDGSNNTLAIERASVATAPTTPPTTPSSTSIADRVAVQLEGTGICVASVDAEGGIQVVDRDWPPFFTRYAIPALASFGTQEDIEGAALKVPGIGVRTLAVLAKRPLTATSQNSNATIALISRHGEVDVDSEEMQRWCTRLQLDATWLANEAGKAAPVASPTLSRLAELTASVNAADLNALALQDQLDSLSGQLSNTYEELSLIYQISSGMRVNRKVDDFFTQACTELIGVMGVRAAGYVVVNPTGGVDTSALFGDIALPAAVIRRLQDDLILGFGASASPLLNNKLAEDRLLQYLAAYAGQLVAVPIQRQDKVLGLLFCLDKLEADFTTQDSKLLNSIANETAIYLENSSLFSDARGMMMGLLHALTSAVDAKDAYTCGHSQRVALFGREIAIRAGLSEQLCERVYMAGLLHDVGKIGVPEEVLRKPGKLTVHEFDQMKTHVTIGARILKDVRQVTDLIPGVLYHHERFDGHGYPHNLVGQNIPLIARILCVADCFDAMTSNRTYRKALPIEVALQEIRKCASSQFDPAMVDAFLSIGAERLRELIGSITDQMSIQLAA